jgi:glutaminase
MIYLLCSKDKVLKSLHHYLNTTLTGQQCQTLQSNQGSKYKNTAMAKFLFNKGITHETTAAQTPEHNRVAERFNCTIIKVVHCMLIDAGLAKTYWGEATLTACAINNHLPTTTNEFATPVDLWLNQHGP